MADPSETDLIRPSLAQIHHYFTKIAEAQHSLDFSIAETARHAANWEVFEAHYRRKMERLEAEIEHLRGTVLHLIADVEFLQLHRPRTKSDG